MFAVLGTRTPILNYYTFIFNNWQAICQDFVTLFFTEPPIFFQNSPKLALASICFSQMRAKTKCCAKLQMNDFFSEPLRKREQFVFFITPDAPNKTPTKSAKQKRCAFRAKAPLKILGALGYVFSTQTVFAQILRKFYG